MADPCLMVGASSSQSVKAEVLWVKQGWGVVPILLAALPHPHTPHGLQTLQEPLGVHRAQYENLKSLHFCLRKLKPRLWGNGLCFVPREAFLTELESGQHVLPLPHPLLIKDSFSSLYSALAKLHLKLCKYTR